MTTQDRWVSTQEAVDALRVSRTKLLKMKVSGALVPGLHWYLANSRRLLWAPELIRAALIQETITAAKRPETYSDLPTRQEVA